MLRTDGLEGAKLVGVGVDVGVEPDQGGPVPARPGREHRVSDRRRLVVPLEREQAERPELVHDRDVRRLLEDLVGQVERPLVVAGLERVARGREDLLGAARPSRDSGASAVTLIGCE